MPQPNKNDDIIRLIGPTANIAAFTMGAMTLSTGGSPILGGAAMTVGGLGLAVRTAAMALSARERDQQTLETKKHLDKGYSPDRDPDEQIVFGPREHSYNLDIWRDADGNIPQGLIDAEMLDKAMRNTPLTPWPAFERAVGRILQEKGIDATFTFADVENEIEADLERLDALEAEEQQRLLYEDLRKKAIERGKLLAERAKNRPKIEPMTRTERMKRLLEKVTEVEREETYTEEQSNEIIRSMANMFAVPPALLDDEETITYDIDQKGYITSYVDHAHREIVEWYDDQYKKWVDYEVRQPKYPVERTRVRSVIDDMTLDEAYAEYKRDIKKYDTLFRQLRAASREFLQVSKKIYAPTKQDMRKTCEYLIDEAVAEGPGPNLNEARVLLMLVQKEYS